MTQLRQKIRTRVTGVPAPVRTVSSGSSLPDITGGSVQWRARRANGTATAQERAIVIEQQKSLLDEDVQRWFV